MNQKRCAALSLSSNGKTSPDLTTIKKENYDCIVLVWLNLNNHQLSTSIISSFRTLVSSFRVYTDATTCYDDIQLIKEKIFLISSSANNDLLSTAENLENLENIFILDPEEHSVDGYYPKLIGVFPSADELLRELKTALYIYEQVQMENFLFENEKKFLWRQLWKSDLINRKSTSNKSDLTKVMRNYHNDNVRMVSLIDEFDKSYRSTDALKWCLHSPFPRRFIEHAISNQNKEQMQLYRFLFTDAAQIFRKQSKRKTSFQVYRGMKLSKQQIDQFENQLGQLMCTNGFFPCTKSRTDALAFASSPTYRSDLISVLFKIDCDSDEFIVDSSALSTVLFDMMMTFRVVCVNHGQMTIIKLKTASADGKKIVERYLLEHSDEKIESLLDRMFIVEEKTTPTDDELKANVYVEQGDVNLALIAYQRIQPVSPRILNIIGRLSLEKKFDHEYAFQCHSQALKMQQQNGNDTTETLVHLGKVYHFRQDFEQALETYQKALQLQNTRSSSDQTTMIDIHVAMSNTYLESHQFEQALEHAERALTLQEKSNSCNRLDRAKTLVLLGNIYQDCDKLNQALDRYSQALSILEREQPVDLFLLAELLNNLGTLQQNLNANNEALIYFERSVEIYKGILPYGHPERVSAEIDFERAKKHNQRHRSTELDNICVNFVEN